MYWGLYGKGILLNVVKEVKTNEDLTIMCTNILMKRRFKSIINKIVCEHKAEQDCH